MTHELTIFKSIFDNRTHRKMTFDSWERFEDLLYSLSTKPGYKPKKDERFHPDASPLISPAIFKSGERRKNVNVEYWGGWAALDVDDYDSTFDEVLDATFNPYRYVCYSSASSTVEKPKFRIVFSLSRNVQANEIRHFWFALNKEFNSIGDPQTKDLSRMYYVPAQYPGAHNFIFSNYENKDPLNVDELLSKYEYARERSPTTFASRLPEHIQREIEEYRRSKLTSRDVKWTGLHDCPFVNQRLIAEYRLITETGWYRKMFQIMVSIASKAMKRGYPISSAEIAALCKELDMMTGSWYKDRNMENEAERAIAFACQNL
jgi:hypothetical protein